MKNTNLLAVLTLAATPAFLHAQTTSYSDVVGYSNVNASSGTVLIVPGFVKASAYSGSATISGQNLSATGLTTGALNTSNHSDRPNYPTHYVEITAGTYEGYSFDIASNTATQITAVGLPSELNGQTVSIVVRPHVTLDDLLAPGLADYTHAVNIINPDGSSTTRFYASNSWIAEDFATPAGHTVIYPGSGYTLSSGGVTLTLTGVVKATKTAVPLYAAAVNYVGPMNPGGNSRVNDLGIAPVLAPYTDGFNVASNDGNMQTTATYFSDGAGILDSGFSNLDPNATDNVTSNAGFTVSVSADGYWIMPSPLGN